MDEERAAFDVKAARLLVRRPGDSAVRREGSPPEAHTLRGTRLGGQGHCLTCLVRTSLRVGFLAALSGLSRLRCPLPVIPSRKSSGAKARDRSRNREAMDRDHSVDFSRGLRASRHKETPARTLRAGVQSILKHLFQSRRPGKGRRPRLTGPPFSVPARTSSWASRRVRLHRDHRAEVVHSAFDDQKSETGADLRPSTWENWKRMRGFPHFQPPTAPGYSGWIGFPIS